MKNIALLVASLGCLMASPLGIRSAEAVVVQRQGFICNMSWITPKQNAGFGNFGGISGGIYTSPYCGGSFVGFFSYYSVGQTYDSQIYAHTETQLWNLFQALHKHQSAGLKVFLSGNNTSSSGNAMDQISFSASYY